MESPQSYVQHRRGSCAFGPEDTVTGVNIGNAILQTSKLEWTQQRRRIVDDDEDAALARSSSFDSQALHGPQVSGTVPKLVDVTQVDSLRRGLIVRT